MDDIAESEHSNRRSFQARSTSYVVSRRSGLDNNHRSTAIHGNRLPLAGTRTQAENKSVHKILKVSTTKLSRNFHRTYSSLASGLFLKLASFIV